MKLEKPIKGKHQGCLHAGVAEELLPMEALIAVGFGDATVEKDGKVVYSEMRDQKEHFSAQDAEDLAKKEPDADWRIHYYGPMADKHYQRQGDGRWVLYEQGIGFA